MSSKSARRRQRKSKHNSKVQKNKQHIYGDKFKIFQTSMNSVLWSGYIRHNTIPFDVQTLCLYYLNNEPIIEQELDKKIPSITNLTIANEPYIYEFSSDAEKKKYYKFQQLKSSGKLNKMKVT
eukprot:115728_1